MSKLTSIEKKQLLATAVSITKAAAEGGAAGDGCGQDKLPHVLRETYNELVKISEEISTS